MNFKGVLFDMDGLLLDSERLVVDAFQLTTDAFELPDMRNVALEMVGLRSDLAEKVLRSLLPAPLDHDAFISLLDNEIMRLFDRGIPLKPGVTELLNRINSLGLPCAVATSTPTEKARHHLENASILGFFQTVTGGDQVQNAKPAPDIYHQAAKSIGQIAENCAAFEDSDPGTKAAIASGATTVQVPDIKSPAPEMQSQGHVISPSLLHGARTIGLFPT